jgi:hypothetical protein
VTISFANDLATGQLLRKWQLPGQPSTVVVSPDEARAVVTLGYQASVVIDLADTSEAIVRRGYSRRVPMQVWLNASPPFFPDGRRIVLAPEQPWKENAYIVDSVTGRQTAPLPSPKKGWVGQNIQVSAMDDS